MKTEIFQVKVTNVIVIGSKSLPVMVLSGELWAVNHSIFNSRPG